MKSLVFAPLALLALTACDRGTQGADTTTEDAVAQGNVVGNSSVGPAPTESATPAPTKIPTTIQGRWGLVPGDCTSTRGDAKGLLVISADNLTFYESRAVPKGNVETSADSFSGDFAFTGEGQSWTRYQSLELQKGGKLVRTESGPMASYTYAQCQ